VFPHLEIASRLYDQAEADVFRQDRPAEVEFHGPVVGKASIAAETNSLLLTVKYNFMANSVAFPPLGKKLRVCV
jgi:hypothetical protein